ncbi:MAG: hypothetical protein J6P13_00525 [Kiritimatiellae bacterium]|nr:hypothetical protein [Kiritimatiellia bacterium]
MLAKAAIICGLGVLASVGYAKDACESLKYTKDVMPSDGVAAGSPVPGEWNSDFVSVKAAAEAESRPMVSFIGRAGCGCCNNLTENAINAEEFRAWAQERKIYMAYVHMPKVIPNTQTAIYEPAQSFYKNPEKATGKWLVAGFPGIAVYWPKQDGTTVKSVFMGRDGYMPAGAGSLAKQLIDSVELTIGDWKAYDGGKFTVGATAGDRLEAEEFTTWVDVFLERDAANSADATNETLRVSYPVEAEDGTAEAEYPVEWAAGETNKTVRLVFKELEGFAFAPGGQIDLTLLSSGGVEADTSLIALVERENSPKNPLWVGVRTADTLAWGEWTMDLDVACAKVLAAKDGGDDAHLLVSLGGSVWCPDCAKTERYLVDTPEFKEWAAKNNIACVAIDIPNFSASAPGKGPCLLTRDKKAASATYMAADPEGGAVQSGAGYLSRWMIEDGEADAIFKRNQSLVGVNTKDGGWNRPERANQYRTGVPVFMCVDAATKKVVSRIEVFAFNSPTSAANVAGHMRRFAELVAVEDAADAALEEDNRDISTLTAEMELAMGGEAKGGVVSGGDLVDVFRLTGVKFDEETVVSATPAAATNVEWRLSIVQVGEGVTNTTASVSGIGELVLEADLVEADGAEVYAKVEVTGLGSNNAVAFGADADATVAYTLAAESVANAGTVGFAASEVEAFIPNGGSYSVTVVREGGRTGAATARVYLKEKGDAAEYDVVAETNFVWAAGETGEKVLSFEAWRPDDTLASGSFTLAVEPTDCEAGLGTNSECVVTLADTSDPCFKSFNIEADAHLTFASAEPIEVMNLSGIGVPTLKKVSGALPPGMSLVYDRKTGAAVLKGTPRKAGVYTVEYTVTQNRKTGLPATITITVDDPKESNPYIGVKRTTQTVPLMVDAGGGTSIVAGTLSITVTAANRITAKLATAKGASISLSGKWTDFDSETGIAGAFLSHRNGTTIVLEMGADGVIYADVNDGEYTAEAMVPETDFADWVGNYTLTFPEDPDEEGDASMAVATMTIAKTGAVRWSATLSNGQTASGTSQIYGVSNSVAYVALFKYAKAYTFSSCLEIIGNGGEMWHDQTQNQLIHDVAGTAAYERIGESEVLRTTYGGWWNKNSLATDILSAFSYSNTMALYSIAFDEREVKASRSGFTVEAVARGDRLAYTKSTGAFSGTISFNVEDVGTVKATVKGVLLPGWYDCGCNPDGAPLVTRPFGAGTATYKVREGKVWVTYSVPVYLRAGAEAE